MASNINPSLEPTKNLVNFRFWCQKVLPLVYDDSLSYYEVLGKMVVQLNDVIDNVNADTDNVLTLKDAFLELQTYVNNFFDDIDQLASYAERAEAAQTAANASAINASESASNASASSLAAMDARDAAVTARQAAQTSANTASTAATNANTKANEAAQSAITAQTAQASASQSATLAATDRSTAQEAANTATTKASEASESATEAENAASSVEASAQQIETNKTDIDSLKGIINNKLKALLPNPILNYNMLIDGDASYTPNVLTVTCLGNLYKLTNPIEYPHKLENVVNACNIGRITTGGAPTVDQALIESGFSIKITVLKGNITATDYAGLRIVTRYSDNTTQSVLADRTEIKSGDVIYYDIPNKNIKWGYQISVGTSATINEETWLLVELISASDRAKTLAMILEN